MSGSADLVLGNFATNQTDKQPDPVTIDAAATVTPTTKLTFLNGQTQVATITPPTTGYSEVTLCFLHAAPGAFATSGNIKTAYQPIQNRPIDLCYDKSSNKWWVKAVV